MTRRGFHVESCAFVLKVLQRVVIQYNDAADLCV